MGRGSDKITVLLKYKFGNEKGSISKDNGFCKFSFAFKLHAIVEKNMSCLFGPSCVGYPCFALLPENSNIPRGEVQKEAKKFDSYHFVIESFESTWSFSWNAGHVKFSSANLTMRVRKKKKNVLLLKA